MHASLVTAFVMKDDVATLMTIITEQEIHLSSSELQFSVDLVDVARIVAEQVASRITAGAVRISVDVTCTCFGFDSLR